MGSTFFQMLLVLLSGRPTWNGLHPSRGLFSGWFVKAQCDHSHFSTIQVCCREFVAAPVVCRFCTVSVAGSFRDFHVDVGGSTAWHSVLRGQKVVSVSCCCCCCQFVYLCKAPFTLKIHFEILFWNKNFQIFLLKVSMFTLEINFQKQHRRRLIRCL